nr:MAG TPA: hypothetical protein [Caudoviricetes sp.]
MPGWLACRLGWMLARKFLLPMSQMARGRFRLVSVSLSR